MESIHITPTLTLEDLQKIKQAIKPILEQKKANVKTSVSKIIKNRDLK
jgi:hypothetical protein